MERLTNCRGKKKMLIQYAFFFWFFFIPGTQTLSSPLLGWKIVAFFIKLVVLLCWRNLTTWCGDIVQDANVFFCMWLHIFLFAMLLCAVTQINQIHAIIYVTVTQINHFFLCVSFVQQVWIVADGNKSTCWTSCKIECFRISYN